MLHSARKHIRAIATIGVASALVVGGVAAAQGDSQGGSQGGPSGSRHMPLPPPPPGPPMKDVTYAEFHVQHNGQAQVVRIDQGKITAVDDSSITLTENDGSSVTIPLDDSTKVLAGPGRHSTVADLSVGPAGRRLRPRGRDREVGDGRAEARSAQRRSARRPASRPPGRPAAAASGDVDERLAP